ncbi:hypothetical protein SMICM17S_04560 [Streptomyces microflavus]
MLVAGGHSNDRIAERLQVSPLTVKTHVNRAMAKVAARDGARGRHRLRIGAGTPSGGVTGCRRTRRVERRRTPPAVCAA